VCKIVKHPTPKTTLAKAETASERIILHCGFWGSPSLESKSATHAIFGRTIFRYFSLYFSTLDAPKMKVALFGIGAVLSANDEPWHGVCCNHHRRLRETSHLRRLQRTSGTSAGEGSPIRFTVLPSGVDWRRLLPSRY
jgi:hypothetical protein